MDAKRILCPVDFSTCSDAALHAACRFATSADSILYIVHVETNPIRYRPGMTDDLANADEHKRLLEEAKPTDDKIHYEQHCLRGNVVDEILHFAEVRDIDLIVIGTHGRTGLMKMLMGSVAESIVKNAKCRVAAIRENEVAEDDSLLEVNATDDETSTV